MALIAVVLALAVGGAAGFFLGKSTHQPVVKTKVVVVRGSQSGPSI